MVHKPNEKLRRYWAEKRATFISPLRGRKMSEEGKQKIRDAWARRKAAGIPSPRIGMRHSEATRKRISEILKINGVRGSRHYSWKGGITPERRKGRKIPGYKTWRAAVRENAGGHCEACHCDRGFKRMCAHHLVSYALHPELATDVSNGAWICDDCHRGCHAK